MFFSDFVTTDDVEGNFLTWDKSSKFWLQSSWSVDPFSLLHPVWSIIDHMVGVYRLLKCDFMHTLLMLKKNSRMMAVKSSFFALCF